MKFAVWLDRRLRKFLLLIEIWWLGAPTHVFSRLARKTKPANYVVSLTSFPARIEMTWVVIESLFRQSCPPKAVVLYLDVDEFDTSRRLPRELVQREKRGLQIRWIQGGGRSYNKLIHAVKEFPNDIVVTVDDDKILPRTYLKQIWDLHLSYPLSIVGGRGWAIRPAVDEKKVIFGKNWRRAQHGEQGRHLFLPGVDVVLYPPGSLDEMVTDLEYARNVTPTNDDIWFWACAMKHQTGFVCAGLPPLRTIPGLEGAPRLNQTNSTEVNNQQFWATIDLLGIKLETLD